MRFFVVVEAEEINHHVVEASNCQIAGKIAYTRDYGEAADREAIIFVVPLKEVVRLEARPTNVVQFIPQERMK